MDLKLKGKTAIVTGGTAGIGLAIVRELVAEGVTVTVPGRERKKLDSALGTFGESVRKIETNVATAEGAALLIKNVSDTDILVNNLGLQDGLVPLDHLFELVSAQNRVRELGRHYFLATHLAPPRSWLVTSRP